MDIARPAGHRPRRLVEAFSSPDSDGLVLLLILVAFALSAAITAAWAIQSFAVFEMLVGQLFLVTAVAKVISAWRPRQARTDTD